MPGIRGIHGSFGKFYQKVSLPKGGLFYFKLNDIVEVEYQNN